MGAALLAAGPTMTGRKWLELASIVARSTAFWSRSRTNLLLTGAVIGAAGSGKVTGKLVVPPNPALITATFTSFGITGGASATLAAAIGIGVAVEYSSNAIYTGEAIGVGAGTDISKVTLANGPALTALIAANMAAQGWVGPQAPQISGALGTAIAALMMTGFGTGAVTGGAGPSPGSGTSVSGVL